MKTIDLRPKLSYQLHLDKEINKELLHSYIEPYGKSPIFVITDTTVSDLYEEKLRSYLSPYKVRFFYLPAGEKYKNIESILKIYHFLVDHNAHRKSLLIAFGGGVIGDLTGYVAATYMRGIDFIQIPTTLLAQVDSSIGGKTGFNFSQGKNNIGAFNQPIAVFMCTSFLESLDYIDWECGYAELIKHAIIRDKALFETLEKKGDGLDALNALIDDSNLLLDVLYQSCLVKAAVVIEDEKESGIRAILNFGHTMGHIYEEASNYKIPHGIAVLLGIAFALYYSHKQGILKTQDYDRILSHINVHLNVHKQEQAFQEIEIAEKEFMSFLQKDKKRQASGITFVVLEELGKATLRKSVSLEDLFVSWVSYL